MKTRKSVIAQNYEEAFKIKEEMLLESDSFLKELAEHYADTTNLLKKAFEAIENEDEKFKLLEKLLYATAKHFKEFLKDLNAIKRNNELKKCKGTKEEILCEEVYKCILKKMPQLTRKIIAFRDLSFLNEIGNLSVDKIEDEIDKALKEHLETKNPELYSKLRRKIYDITPALALKTISLITISEEQKTLFDLFK